jgi:hypothetical protein
MIDPSSGAVRIANCDLPPTTDRTGFLESAAGRNARLVVENVPWLTYAVTDDNGGVLLAFEDEALRSMSLSLFLPGEAPSGEGGSGSAKREGDRKKLHDELLADHSCGAPAEFPWGRILSSLDPRSGGAVIHVSYR